MMVALAKQDNQIGQTFPVDQVIHGDSLVVLKTLPSNFIDALVCDPPSAINFMGKSWDSDKGGRSQWVAWLSSIMQEALRVLKPGGYGLIWALPRTSHWTALALEDAGFLVKDCVSHIFGSGFPKSLDISKAIDRMAGAERTEKEWYDRYKDGGTRIEQPSSANISISNHSHTNMRTLPTTPEAQQWSGFGSALKPSTEFWWLVQKPISEKSIAANVLKWGVGGLNIAATRVGGQAYSQEQWNKKEQARTTGNTYGAHKPSLTEVPQGRFPSHLLLSHSVWCVPRGVKRVRGTAPRGKPSEGLIRENGHPFSFGVYQNTDYADPDGMETVEDYDCDSSCPIRILNEQSGIRKSGGGDKSSNRFPLPGNAYRITHTQPYECEPSEGGASRYFQTFHYFSKSSRRERNQGCEGLPETTKAKQMPMVKKCGKCGGWENTSMRLARRPNSTCICVEPEWIPETQGSESFVTVQNTHPTVKSLSLMSWLCRLITPPGGIVLDPFLGSGSTAVAAIHEDFHFIGIEAESDYVAIAEARIGHAYREVQ